MPRKHQLNAETEGITILESMEEVQKYLRETGEADAFVFEVEQEYVVVTS